MKQDFIKIASWLWQDYEELKSTNDTAQNIIVEDKHAKFVITARRQTNGRGRLGRIWQSFEGNLFMSLNIAWDIKESAAMVLISGISLAETILKTAPSSDVKLKWPNDVLLNDKKVSGILIEGAGNNRLIIGIGVNIVACPKKQDVLYEATSLQKSGILIGRIDFLRAYLQEFDRYTAIYQQKGMQAIADLWQCRAKGIGQKIKILTSKNEQSGIFCGIDEKGMLLLRTDSPDLQKICVGDVFF
ncbi:MAG: biotin--[Alphaproteobacteria bacterium]|nr:biotin--[acetyl-CoA-carboxylase] ligase [Alphaproteobacteria bacterium]